MERTRERGGARRGGVAVLGAGTMGSTMARRLLACGFGVRVWNRGQGPLGVLAEAGAETSSDPRDAVQGADVVLTLLPTADVVSDLMTRGGVLDAMRPGQAWAQMGTIGVDGTRRLAELVRATQPGVLFVDAPVSGSRAPAQAGQLVVLASGPDDAKAIVGPVFDALGRRTLWLGPAGFGSRMKLVLNTWLAFEVEAAAEALALARRWEITDDLLSDATAGSPLVSTYAASKLEKMIAGDDSPDFSLEMALKDLTLVEEAAGLPRAPVAASIADRWRTLVARDLGALDVSVAREGLGSSPAGERVGPARGAPVGESERS